MILLLSFRLMRTSPRFVHSVTKSGKGSSPLEPNPGFLSGRATPTSFQVPGLGKDPLQHRKFGGYLEISPTPGLEVCGFGHGERRREARK
jgi:hypothetical protein